MSATASPRKGGGKSVIIDEEAAIIVSRQSPERLSPSGKNERDKRNILPVSIESVSDDVVPPFSWAKLWEFAGPGLLMSVAFLDPGNLEGDLQAGAIAGYSLLWLIMWATGLGLLVQLLSARLGVASGRHLAEICKEEYPFWAGISLWLMAEVALIAADIQEVIGSAIAIKILSNGYIPLWAGVLITACDCLFLLFIESYGIRKLEAIFAFFIGMMALSFAWMFADTKPSGRELVIGLVVPKLSTKTIQQAVGIVGCVLTPYNVFLHSALVQSRKTDPKNISQVREALNYYSIECSFTLLVSFGINLCVTSVFAVGFYNTKQAETVGLENAGEYLQEKYGGGLLPIFYLWGIGLLVAGQSSTITGTYAGQFIMGGFLDLHLKKWLRSLISRSCAILPTIIIAIIFQSSATMLDMLNEWLNVVQSVQIPFALIPLFTVVSKEHIMGIFKIGPVMQRTLWAVTGLVIVINGYVLVDFFMSKVRGVLAGIVVCAIIAAYMAFNIYLISYGTHLSNSWTRLKSSESHDHA